MPVGNDVVDLRDPEAHGETLHPRFDLRVFTPQERERIAAAAAELATGVTDLAARLRWSLWAAKESAFKAAQKLDPGIPFHPRRFAVSILEAAQAEVVHRSAGRFDVWLEEARGWVHAVAQPSGLGRPRPRWVLDFLSEGQQPAELPPGERVRLLARRTLAPLLSLDPDDLRIVSEGGIPTVRRGNDALPVDLSLSHHGRLVACAWSAR